jgi:hypothetical protein
MKKIFNNNYFSVGLLPGIVFGIVVDDSIVYIVIGFIEVEIKTFNFFRKRKNKFGSLKK